MSKLRLAVIILAIAMAGCSPRPITNIEAKGVNIVCFGDSLTEGVGAARGKSYPDYLALMVDHAIINAGIGGNTTGDALARIEEDVLAYKPKMVIVILGGNDFMRKSSKVGAIANMNKIVDRIHKNGAMVVMASVKFGPLYDIYTKEFKSMAHEKGAIFVPDLMKGIYTNPKLKFDQIHPNAAGYKIMAERIHETIEPYL